MTVVSDDIVAIGDDDELQADGYFGAFTLPDEERNGAIVVREWAKAGLDPDDLPEARQPVHIFQSACASVRTRKGSNGHGKVEITADEIEHTSAVCSYQVTFKVWDIANHAIEHEKAMRATFDKKQSKLTFDQLDVDDRHMRELSEQIAGHYEANAETVPGQKIRNAVRNTLLKVGAQNLRGKAGGLYFVPPSWSVNGGPREETQPILEGLRDVLAELYDERGDMIVIPYVRDESLQKLIRKQFIANVRERLEDATFKAMNRVRQGRGQRGVRPELVTGLQNERRQIAHAVGEFKRLVDIERDDLADNLADFDDALDKLEQLAT